MNNINMSLTNKTDAQILSELKAWVGKERDAVTHVLHYLREVEERKLYLLGASSLKEFCMKVLKYSRHEAQARIDAMRLLKVVPEIDADLDSGKLSLTVAAQTMSSFRKEDARRETTGESPLSEEECKTVLAELTVSLQPIFRINRSWREQSLFRKPSLASNLMRMPKT
jgi:hypothetical protein